jgi:hypothetical protein
MNERDWAACDDPEKMLTFLEASGRGSERKFRLFAVACCRAAGESLWPAEMTRHAALVAEHYADGQADESALDQAARAVLTAMPPAARAVRSYDAFFAALAGTARRAVQVRLIRDIFGLLAFRTITLDSSLVKWNDGCVGKIAEGIYQERAFDRMGILHDALLDAGCADDELLEHCRKQGKHVAGCWVIDLLTGRE